MTSGLTGLRPADLAGEANPELVPKHLGPLAPRDHPVVLQQIDVALRFIERTEGREGECGRALGFDVSLYQDRRCSGALELIGDRGPHDAATDHDYKTLHLLLLPIGWNIVRRPSDCCATAGDVRR